MYFTCRSIENTVFTYVCNSTLPEQKQIKSSVHIPSGWCTFNSKFELNPPSQSKDMYLKSSSYKFSSYFFLFATLFEIAITHTCFNGCLEIWSTIRAYLQFFFSIRVEKSLDIINSQMQSFVMPTR